MNYEEIISLENLFLAWKEFKKGKIKKIDVWKFSLFLEQNVSKLHEELKSRKYNHSPYISFYINDPKLRHIHKACVRDRVLHHAIFRILYSLFDKSFIFDSYSCRINKGTHKAIDRLNHFARKENQNNTKTIYLLKLDIKKFFDSVDHNILLFLIKKKIKDKNTIWLIKTIIDSFSTNYGRGIPLGNITSQLFANIYLNKLDYFIKYNLRIKYYIRYCDDFVMINKDKEYLESIIPIINNFLRKELKLSLHPNKIIIKKYHQGIDFLGYVSFPEYRLLRTKTKIRMFKKIKRKKRELSKGLISESSFNQTLQSYLGVLKHCNGYELEKKIIRDIDFFV